LNNRNFLKISSSFFKKRTINKDTDKKTFDPVREKIARRAALEFKNGMYGRKTLSGYSYRILVGIN
jgi:hypothetical protein